jgi:hypothetical protein
LINSQGKKVTDHEDMCCILNEYFGSVFTEEVVGDKLPEVTNIVIEEGRHMLSSLDITRTDIVKILKSLIVNKAPGVDGIVPRLLIENAYCLGEALEYIYKESLDKAVVPKEWKRANVTAIYKKGSRELPSNHRPVSLTSQVCKVLESIIRDGMLDYLTRNNLIKDSQHGFSKNRSCLTNLLKFLEMVSKYIDEGLPVDVIYLDFQKAFDKVLHKRLMLKLTALGITGLIFIWIRDWLQDREQRAVLLVLFLSRIFSLSQHPVK